MGALCLWIVEDEEEEEEEGEEGAIDRMCLRRWGIDWPPGARPLPTCREKGLRGRGIASGQMRARDNFALGLGTTESRISTGSRQPGRWVPISSSAEEKMSKVSLGQRGGVMGVLHILKLISRPNSL